jgi:hypothetical protein
MEVNTAVISLDRLKELESAERKANDLKEAREEIQFLKSKSFLLHRRLKKMNYWAFRRWKNE